MDYLPPEKPAIVAKADSQFLAQRYQSPYAWCLMGEVKELPDPGDWKDLLDEEQQERLEKLKPGQKAVFAKPESAPEPVWYIYQHKPCSTAAFSAFEKLIQKPTVMPLTEAQLLPLKEIIGTKPCDKASRTESDVLAMRGRHALSVCVTNAATHRTSHALYVISDSNQRLIQEVGFDGANFKNHWGDEAETMLMGIEFRPKK